MKALKSGEATIILPDQVPGNEGVWAPFLANRLHHESGAAPGAGERCGSAVFCWRAPATRRRLSSCISSPCPAFQWDKDADCALLNRTVEDMIRRFPSHLWSYNRYKCPAGVTPPDHQQGNP
jgi:KDO2-lipid IV(A) lauroyltransferase